MTGRVLECGGERGKGGWDLLGGQVGSFRWAGVSGIAKGIVEGTAHQKWWLDHWSFNSPAAISARGQSRVAAMPGARPLVRYLNRRDTGSEGKIICIINFFFQP